MKIKGLPMDELIVLTCCDTEQVVGFPASLEWRRAGRGAAVERVAPLAFCERCGLAFKATWEVER